MRTQFPLTGPVLTLAPYRGRKAPKEVSCRVFLVMPKVLPNSASGVSEEGRLGAGARAITCRGCLAPGLGSARYTWGLSCSTLDSLKIEGFSPPGCQPRLGRLLASPRKAFRPPPPRRRFASRNSEVSRVWFSSAQVFSCPCNPPPHACATSSRHVNHPRVHPSCSHSHPLCFFSSAHVSLQSALRHFPRLSKTACLSVRPNVLPESTPA